MFINYSDQGIQIRPFQLASATVVGIGDIAQFITKGEVYPACCDIDGAKDALEDGHYLSMFDVSQAAVEQVYNAICEYEEGEAAYEAEADAQDAWDTS